MPRKAIKTAGTSVPRDRSSEVYDDLEEGLDRIDSIDLEAMTGFRPDSNSSRTGSLSFSDND